MGAKKRPPRADFTATIKPPLDKLNRISFFSPGLDFIPVGVPLIFDLYVNSSVLEERERFVKVFPIGETLTDRDLKMLRTKYSQLYIPEQQRDDYLRALTKSDKLDDVAKVTAIKDSAVHYLEGLFSEEKVFSTELLNEAIDGCREAVESMVDVLQDQDIDSLQGLIGQLSFHDFYTYDHSINVSMYNITIYRALRPNASRIELLHAGLGGMLHDLGKINIPTHIINNPGKLTEEEFSQIREHPGFGKDLLERDGCEASDAVSIEVVARVVHEHHENFDGTGYPNKLKGDEIHLLAKVTAISDFFDAITTKRSYHKPMTVPEALAVMQKTVGKKLDPDLFDLFVKHINQVVEKNSRLVMDEEFDPCQPHKNLPLRLEDGDEGDEGDEEDEDGDFGGIVVKE